LGSELKFSVTEPLWAPAELVSIPTVRSDASLEPGANFDAEGVQSQAETVTTTDLARKAVDRLQLDPLHIDLPAVALAERVHIQTLGPLPDAGQAGQWAEVGQGIVVEVFVLGVDVSGVVVHGLNLRTGFAGMY